ncbi:MAG: hypothetical protein ACK4Q4_09680 [Rhodocyclaceae bacterium]
MSRPVDADRHPRQIAERMTRPLERDEMEIQLKMRSPPGWGILDRGDEMAFLRLGVWSQAQFIATDEDAQIAARIPRAAATPLLTAPSSVAG